MGTSFETIRSAQVSVIEALAPAHHAGTRFRRHREGDFAAWVAKSPKACLRRFQILASLNAVQGPTADGSIESCSHTIEVQIAYPLTMGTYGAENERDMEDVMRADAHQIDAAIGLNGGANYVTYQDLCQKQEQAVLDVEGARVLSITYLVQYDRSV